MTSRGKAPRWQAPFLRALRATRNVRLAAARVGVDHSACYQRRRRHPDFADEWDRALAEEPFDGARDERPLDRSASLRGACARDSRNQQALGSAAPPPPFRRSCAGADCPRQPATLPGEGRPAHSPANAGEDLIIRHSKAHGAQLVKAGAGRWSRKAEDHFLTELGRTGNIRRAARAAGFSANAVHGRMNNYPAFAERCQAAIVRARADLESLVLGAGIATFDPAGVEDGEGLPRLTVAEAIAYLRLSPSAKGARGGRASGCGEPSIEAVRDEVLGRLAAIRGHRAGGEMKP